MTSFPEPHIEGYTSLYPGTDEVDSTSWSASQAYTAGAMISTVTDLTKWARLVGTGALITPELQAERLKWDRLGDNDDNWHYTFGLEENSGWIGHNGMIPGYFTFQAYNPELDATIVIAMNSDKKVNGEQGINVLLRDISAIKSRDSGAPLRLDFMRHCLIRETWRPYYFHLYFPTNELLTYFLGVV